MRSHFLDAFSIGSLFLLTFLLMVLTLELGFQFGRRQNGKSVKAQTSQVRALMGATLGLLAFMLAFTFSSAQNHFETRIQLQIDEAVLAKEAFMQADLYPDSVRRQARELLLEYVEGRVKLIEMVRDKQAKQILHILDRASEIHSLLWTLSLEAQTSASQALGQSALGLMDLQTRRIQAALANRTPAIIWLTLYFTAVVAMIVVGYQAGLTQSRSPIATFSMALAFSAVMMLILDLDRPLQSFFEVDVSVMRQVAELMRTAM